MAFMHRFCCFDLFCSQSVIQWSPREAFAFTSQNKVCWFVSIFLTVKPQSKMCAKPEIWSQFHKCPMISCGLVNLFFRFNGSFRQRNEKNENKWKWKSHLNRVVCERYPMVFATGCTFRPINFDQPSDCRRPFRAIYRSFVDAMLSGLSLRYRIHSNCLARHWSRR